MEGLNEMAMHKSMQEALHTASWATQPRDGMKHTFRCQHCINGIEDIKQS